MPELPEVETVRAGIADHSLGRPVQAVRVVDARSLRRHLPGPAHFEAALTGRRCAVHTAAANTCG